MKILNFNSNINYGYNIKYHKNLHKKLEERKQNKELALFLKKADELSLEIEDRLIELEKNPKKTTTDNYLNLSCCLIDVKSAIAYSMAVAFNALKYCDNLISQYLKEIKTLNNPEAIMWRKNLCKNLSAYSIKKYPELEDEKRETQKTFSKDTQNDDSINSAAQELNKTLKNISKEKTDDQDIPNVLSLYEPSQTSPKGLDDVVGLKKEKQRLKEELIDYINDPIQAQQDNLEYGITAPVGYLFFGPPGCGKTYITQAIAAESGSTMFKMDVSKVGSKYVNQTANNIQEAFDYLSNISKDSPKPILLFMDEVDSLARNRSFNQNGSSEDLKATTTLLKLLDNAKDNNIIVIAATNKFDMLDEAFVNRFNEPYYFGMPDEEQINSLLIKLLSSRTKGQNLANDKEALKEISQKLFGFSNRSIVFITNEAAKNARRNSRREIQKQDFIEAIESTDLEKINEKDFKKESKKTSKIGFCSSIKTF